MNKPSRRRQSVFGARARGARLERVRASPRFKDGQFRNTASGRGPGLKGNPLPMLGEFFFGGAERIPSGPLPVHNPQPAWARRAETGLRVTWLGHSTLLLELDGFKVLTDPVFGERASPASFAGPRRFHAAPVAISALPELDAVLVSHDHYDHLCAHTIAELAARQTPFFTSLGVGAHLEAWGIAPERITELDWWEEATLEGGRLSFTAAPAQHFSGRGVADRNATSWSSWVIRSDNHRVFFSGDTGLTEEFRTVGQRLGPFDVAMFEVGAFHPTWGDIHLGPENALAAHQLLGSGIFLPVHWGTFNLALHAWDDPAEQLVKLANEKKVRIFTPRLGEALEPDRVDFTPPWWREVRGRQRAPDPAPVGTAEG
jgi:L-ascorbate metabolism protein UlaG (beta-lactamase superfamily)